jgi:spoIIIJ-associated protein
VEWVETTGKTVEEAKDAALDQLGVDEQDAEFEVVEEPRTGLFGRTRGDARVRARVRPTQPRPKVERRERRGKGGGRPAKPGERKRRDGGGRGGTKAPAAAPAAEGRDRKRPSTGGARRPAAHQDDEQGSNDMSETELAEQGEVVRGFLVDLLDAFGFDGEVTATPAEEGAVELAVTGGDLGLLIGPKGATLQAIQELSRSVLQRQLPGESHARIRVDVSGYRARRKEALEVFVRQVAEDVRSAGTQKALEPMSPPDRKVVHDTVNDIDGVHTISEGEDARRRVVIIPD